MGSRTTLPKPPLGASWSNFSGRYPPDEARQRSEVVRGRVPTLSAIAPVRYQRILYVGTASYLGVTGARLRAGPCHGWKPVRVSAVRPWVSLALQPYLPYPNSCQGTSPHQQGRGTKVSEPYNVGIDVSIDRLDVAIRPGGRGFCVTNDAAGWADLVARLPRGAIAAIGLGASPRAGTRSSLAPTWLNRSGLRIGHIKSRQTGPIAAGTRVVMREKWVVSDPRKPDFL